MKNIGWAQGIWEQSSTQKEILGAYRVEPNGKKYRYALAGEGLAVGKMSYMSIAEAEHVNKSVAAAAAIGDTEVTVTVGATAVTLDQYKDGELQVNDGTGKGHSYDIDTNTACATSGNTVVTLKDAIKIALVASATSEVTLVKSPWGSVTQSTTEESGSAGITKMAITDANYFWIQTGGSAILLGSGSDGLGTVLSHDATEGAGAVMADYTKGLFGFTWNTAHVSGEYKPVILFID